MVVLSRWVGYGPLSRPLRHPEGTREGRGAIPYVIRCHLPARHVLSVAAEAPNSGPSPLPGTRWVAERLGEGSAPPPAALPLALGQHLAVLARYMPLKGTPSLSEAQVSVSLARVWALAVSPFWRAVTSASLSCLLASDAQVAACWTMGWAMATIDSGNVPFKQAVKAVWALSVLPARRSVTTLP